MLSLADLNAKLATLVDQGRAESAQASVLAQGTAFETQPDAQLVKRLQATRSDSQVVGTSWFSDAGPLSTCCEEIVVFGPGSIKQAHTKDEFIRTDDLQQGTEILRDFLLRFAAE